MNVSKIVNSIWWCSYLCYYYFYQPHEYFVRDITLYCESTLIRGYEFSWICSFEVFSIHTNGILLLIGNQILWFGLPKKNHENWYLMNGNAFTVHLKTQVGVNKCTSMLSGPTCKGLIKVVLSWVGEWVIGIKCQWHPTCMYIDHLLKFEWLLSVLMSLSWRTQVGSVNLNF